MKYLRYVLGGFLLSGFIYVSIPVILYPAPISAEYWVREVLVIKRALAREVRGKQKIVVAAGSNVLFGVDTNLLTKELGLPALNLGLTAGLSLDAVLREAKAIVESGDIVILPLEPDYYCREDTQYYKEWAYRNAIAWDTQQWNALTLRDHLESWRFISPHFSLEVLRSKISKLIDHPSVRQRLAALDDNAILKKYQSPKNSSEPIYSVYNIDYQGNIKNSDESNYRGTPRRADVSVRICDAAIKSLSEFASVMTSRNVRVFLAHAPYVNTNQLDLSAVRSNSLQFRKALEKHIPILDEVEDVLFDRQQFLDSDMHLNSIGREIRTVRLIAALRRGLGHTAE